MDTSSQSSTIILQFIRLASDSKFEKITWYKTSAGEKYSTKQVVTPSPEQAVQIAATHSQELIITNTNVTL